MKMKRNRRLLNFSLPLIFIAPFIIMGIIFISIFGITSAASPMTSKSITPTSVTILPTFIISPQHFSFFIINKTIIPTNYSESLYTTQFSNNVPISYYYNCELINGSNVYSLIESGQIIKTNMPVEVICNSNQPISEYSFSCPVWSGNVGFPLCLKSSIPLVINKTLS